MVSHFDSPDNGRQGNMSCSRGGVTDPISSVPIISHIFRIMETLVFYWSRSYLKRVSAAELKWHLPNMKVIEMISEVRYLNKPLPTEKL